MSDKKLTIKEIEAAINNGATSIEEIEGKPTVHNLEDVLHNTVKPEQEQFYTDGCYVRRLGETGFYCSTGGIETSTIVCKALNSQDRITYLEAIIKAQDSLSETMNKFADTLRPPDKEAG